MACDKDSNTNS